MENEYVINEQYDSLLGLKKIIGKDNRKKDTDHYKSNPVPVMWKGKNLKQYNKERAISDLMERIKKLDNHQLSQLIKELSKA